MSWSGTGEAYAASYARLCAGTGQRMRVLAGPARGRSLLDVGAGDGTLAAAWKDAGWRVTAADPEDSMRSVARRQHPWLRLVPDSLPALSFGDGAFDVVTANFVLNHLSDPRAGAAELRRVARQVVLASTWTASPSSLWAEITARAGLVPMSGARLAAENDFERTADGFGRMLREAGWQPEVTELTWTWSATPEALWLSVAGGVAGAGMFYASLSAGQRRRFRRAFDDHIDALLDGGSVPLTHTAAIAVERCA